MQPPSTPDRPTLAPPTPAGRFDRRTFIIGAAAVGMLAACGGETADSFELVQRFPSDVFVPGEIRLPFSIARAAEFISDGPAELSAQVLDENGNKIGATITAVRRDITPSAYYAFRTELDSPGIYVLQVEGGPATGANFQVLDPTAVSIPKPGDILPDFDTPTVADSGGVDPICTRDPQCPFHAVTLTDALASGKAVAYFVGTPAFCQTGSCTPALETLIAESAAHTDDIVFVHAEIWTDSTASVLTPAVEALGLSFEPTLFLARPDGTVAERVDGLWDATEVRERLAALVA